MHSETPLLFLTQSDPPTKSTGRILELAVLAADPMKPRKRGSGELVCDERKPDGSVNFQIEVHRNAGYLMSGPAYGSHLVSADGQLLRCYPEGRPDAVWQRFLIAQILPFAALLQGLEVFHASAVVEDGRAIAFLGPSRAGKTSLALELCRRGASFLADDVVAVEPRSEQLLAHAGTPVAGVDRADAKALTAGDIVAVNTREQLVRMPSARAPAPLAALFFLDRRTTGPESPRFESVADARMLLAATFNFVLATPERLRGLLDVCALAARLPVERVTIGRTTSSSELSAAVKQRLRSSP